MRRLGPRQTCAIWVVTALALTGCTGEDPAPAAFDRAWTVPDDACDRLDLPTLLGQFDGAAVANPRAAHEDSPTQCLVDAGDITDNVSMSVTFEQADDQQTLDLDWEGAVMRLNAAPNWPSVTTASPATTGWPGESRSSTYGWVQGRLGPSIPSYTRVLHTRALRDGDLVVDINVLVGSKAPSDEVLALTNGMSQAVTDALIDGVLEPVG